jgi:hypothetical protein
LELPVAALIYEYNTPTAASLVRDCTKQASRSVRNLRLLGLYALPLF